MADEVRVAADRRREVAVGRRAQPGVPDVARRVVGLLERAQQERAERAPATALAPLHVPLDAQRDLAEQLGGLRARHALGQRRRRHVERRELRDEPFDAFGLGALVHAVQARRAALLEQPRDGFVGGDHQMLDQAVRLGLRARVDRGDVAALVEDELGLLGVDDERAGALARGLQRAQRPRARPRAARPTAPARARDRRRCDRRARSRGARRSGSAIGRTRRSRPRRRRARARRSRRGARARARASTRRSTAPRAASARRRPARRRSSRAAAPPRRRPSPRARTR